jgi:hypothetical protein
MEANKAIEYLKLFRFNNLPTFKKELIDLIQELEGYKNAWEYLEDVSKSGELTEVMNNIKNMFLKEAEKLSITKGGENK